MDDATLHTNIFRALRETVDEFQFQPADFLYEFDVQAVLYSKLRNSMRESAHVPNAKEFHRLFKLNAPFNPVKAEYPVNLEGARGRFDVAVLSHHNDPQYRIWWQPCRVGIEIKLWQTYGSGGGPRGDLRRLQNYWQACQLTGRQFTGIALVFVHPGSEPWQKHLDGAVTAPAIATNGVNLHIISPEEWKTVNLSSWEDVGSTVLKNPTQSS